MKSILFFLAVFLTVYIYACNGNDAASDNTAEGRNTAEETSSRPVPPGKAIFEQRCAPCHGSNGTSGIGNAANLQKSKLDSSSISKVISEGKGGMPSFSIQLTQNEIAALSGYVLGMRK